MRPVIKPVIRLVIHLAIRLVIRLVIHPVTYTYVLAALGVRPTFNVYSNFIIHLIIPS